MKYLPFDIAIRLTHNVRHIKGQLVEHSLCIVRSLAGKAGDLLQHSLDTTVNYLVIIVPIVYLDFQAWPASPAGVQLDSGMGHDTNKASPPETILGLIPVLEQFLELIPYELLALSDHL
ncbi:hypothetical protein DSO57_1028730 [Entomophthora muscae]|uniref:Uncharacterized protein n=1 Tax=Entomophthora muscae TaxID=34485 RepID=A0ACC2UMQ5_9FUNG|nr:hypothetical protein DSO57_1028730 [Entomophthora muscae]